MCPVYYGIQKLIYLLNASKLWFCYPFSFPLPPLNPAIPIRCGVARKLLAGTLLTPSMQPLHPCSTRVQAHSPRWKKSCRILGLCQKQPIFLSVVFGSSLAEIFQEKVQAHEILLCVKVFRLLFGDVKRRLKIWGKSRQCTGLIRQRGEPHL